MKYFSGFCHPNCSRCGRQESLDSEASVVAANEVETNGANQYRTHKTDSEGEHGEDESAKQQHGEASDEFPNGLGPERAQHVYSSIRDGGKKIRLFSLDPGPPSSPISGQLITVTLESDDQPTYEALSYTWADGNGDRDYSTRLWCGAGFLCVTKNAGALLRRVKMRTKSRLVWMDQICINQSDLSERSQQVGLMPRIYKKASQVLIYLGSSSTLDDVLPTLLRDMACVKLSYQVEAYQPLVRLPWFTRIWVLQEVAKARKAVMLGQKCCVDFESFRFIFQTQTVQPPPAFSIWPCSLVPATRILDLLIGTNACDATDPKDKVFALFGIIDSAEEHGLIADYNKDVKEVYTETALYIIKTSSVLDLLAWCSGEESFLSLPSWVPDWSTRRRTPLIKYVKDFYGVTKFDERLNIPVASPHYFPGSGTLLIKGRHFASIRSRWKCYGDGMHPYRLPEVFDKESLWEYELMLDASELDDWRESISARAWIPCGHKASEVGTEVFITGNAPAFGVKEIREGDQIWTLDGAEQPFALREHGDAFKVVGECFLPGLLPRYYGIGKSLFQGCIDDYRFLFKVQTIELC